MIYLIAAVSENMGIGRDNKLLFRISEDLKRFKNITWGQTILMGRKTFESLPKPLKNRKILVMTRNLNYEPKFSDNVEIIHELQNIIDTYKHSGELFVCGGEQIYKQTINFCDKIFLTKVHENFTADTFFPDIPNNFIPSNSSEKYIDNNTKLKFQYITYTNTTLDEM